jgi:predicted neuraminidase
MIVLEARKQFIFENQSHFQSCHAATILALPDGSFLVAWFGGTGEGDPNVDIWCSRKQAEVWSAPWKIAGKDGIAHWNPVFFQDSVGDILLYYKVGATIPTWFTMFITSRDGGRSWSEPEKLVEADSGGRGPVRNKPIVLHDGTWVAPASIETDDHWDAFVDRSSDKGKTWTKSDLIQIDHASIQGKGIIQPTLWESGTKQVHMLLRSTSGYIYRSDSHDKGETWSSAYPIPLPNNNSGIDLVKLENHTLVLVHNPVMGDGGARTPLVCSVSEDNGLSWNEAFVLENEPGEYSYPAIVALGNRTYIVYTWKRERIVFWDILWK